MSKLVSANPRKGDAAIAEAVTAEKNNTFAKMQRYVNAADRAFKKVLAQLREMQQIRREEEQQQRVNDILRARMAARNGFVSQPPQSTPVATQPDSSGFKNPPPESAEAPKIFR